MSTFAEKKEWTEIDRQRHSGFSGLRKGIRRKKVTYNGIIKLEDKKKGKRKVKSGSNFIVKDPRAANPALSFDGHDFFT